MNLAGLLIMIVSLSSVLGLSVYCFYKVLRLPPQDPDNP